MMLTELYKETEDGTITSLIVRPTVLQIPEYLSIYATSQTGLHLYTTNSFVFGAYSSNIHISDISLCKVFTDFFTGLSGSPMVYSKEETLCLIKAVHFFNTIIYIATYHRTWDSPPMAGRA